MLRKISSRRIGVPAKKKLDILIWGGYGVGNLGDDLLLITLINVLKNCGVSESKIGIRANTQCEYIRKIYPEISIIPDGLQIYVKVLLFGGGTQFFSYPPPGNILIKNLRKIKSRWNYYNYKIRKNQFRNIHYNHMLGISLGIGPFNGDKGMINLVERWIESHDCLFLRDDEAYRYVMEHKTDNIGLYSDIVFAKNNWMSSPLKGLLCNSVKVMNITFIVRDWHYNDALNYLYSIIQVARNLIRRGYRINFISLSANRDIRIKKVLENSGFLLYAWDPNKQSLEEYLQTFCTRSDLVISARAHGLVLSSIFGIPSIGVGIDDKISLIMRNEKTGITWTHPYKPSSLMNRIDYIIENYSQAKAQAKRSSDRNGEIATQGISEFLVYLQDYLRS